MKKVEIKGRSRVQTVLAFLLLISVLISASGCRRSVSPPKEGLAIKENIKLRMVKMVVVPVATENAVKI